MDGDQRTCSCGVKSTDGPHLEVFDRRAEGRSGGGEKRGSDFPTRELQRGVAGSSRQLFKAGQFCCSRKPRAGGLGDVRDAQMLKGERGKGWYGAHRPH